MLACLDCSLQGSLSTQMTSGDQSGKAGPRLSGSHSRRHEMNVLGKSSRRDRRRTTPRGRQLRGWPKAALTVADPVPRRATTPAPWGGEWSPYGDDPDPRSCSGGRAGPWRRPQPLGDGDADLWAAVGGSDSADGLSRCHRHGHVRELRGRSPGPRVEPGDVVIWTISNRIKPRWS